MSRAGAGAVALDEDPHADGVDEGDGGEIEHEQLRVVVLCDGGRQPRHGGHPTLVLAPGPAAILTSVSSRPH